VLAGAARLSGRGRAFIGLGGNLGDPRAAMRRALDLLDADYDTDVVRVSSLYRTPPWGNTDQPDFLNAVAEIATTRDPRNLLELCLYTEQALHRVRAERWGPRTIDLDLLAYDDVVMAEPQLELPHPRLTERAFVLVPLAEIAPDLVVKSLPVAEWLALIDTGGIVREAAPGWWRVD
jgi:2-amino-4-hydroxy-6-hydroxymethyldihydropteridine diphosphokinase